jgi:hypothetical protein
MMLVDKNVNCTNSENKSVFSIGDYRHNLPYKEDADHHSSKVSQLPKTFFGWNDGTKFNAKYKKDI